MVQGWMKRGKARVQLFIISILVLVRYFFKELFYFLDYLIFFKDYQRIFFKRTTFLKKILLTH